MSDLAWLFVALIAVWAGIGAYLLSIGVRQRRLERRLQELQKASDALLTNAQSRRSDGES
jgi:CcmD family protein